MTENLWGKLPTGEGIRTPHSVLVEQGQLLTKSTDGQLVGRVRRGAARPDGKLVSILHIVVPSLDYSFRVVDLIYSVELYPVLVSPPAPAPDTQARNEQDLQAQLKTIFTSERVRRVIGGLMAQIRADSEEKESDEVQEK